MAMKTNQEIVELNENISVVPYIGSNRILASMIDWVVGGIVSGFPSAVMFSILTGTGKPLTDMYQFEAAGFDKQVTIFVALLCLIFGMFYYVIVPWLIWPGQTLGKYLTHTKIVRHDHQKLGVKLLFLRQFVFLICIEGMATTTSTYIKVLVTTLTRFYTDSYLTVFWGLLTLISMILVFMSNKHLALHDLVLKTTVILDNSK